MYGFSNQEIKSMSIREFVEYYNCIAAIKAQESLLAFEAASSTKLKKTDRSKLYRDKQRVIDRTVKTPNKSVTFGEMFSRVKGRINGN